MDEALAVSKEEGYEDGFEAGERRGEQRGMAQKQNELIRKFSKKLSPEDIAETLQVSKEYVLSVLQENDAKMVSH